MKKALDLKAINILILLVCTLFSYEVKAQTSFWEKIFINHYFDSFIADIKDKTKVVLSKEEQKIASKVKIILDSNDTTSFNANSDSKNRQINFSNKLARYLVKYSVSQFIDFDTLSFNRKRFSGFYLSLYPYLDPSISPEKAAELTEQQIEFLNKVGNTNEFAWTVKSKLLFIYLHELGHQVQNYSGISKKIISNKKLNQIEKDSLLLNLEIEADRFAIDKIAKIDIDPTINIETILSFFTIIKENKSTLIEDIVYRKVLYYSFLGNAFGCNQNKSHDSLCQRIGSGLEDNVILFRHYRSLFQRINSSSKISKLKEGKNAFDYYNMGDFYLRGTEFTLANVDSSLVYYELGAQLPTDGSELFGAKSLIQLKQIVEYCQLVAGKIHEIKLKNKTKALAFYEKAMKISIMFPEDYYTALIKRLRSS